MGSDKSESSSFEKQAFSIPTFCYRNDLSRTTYHRLRAEGRGPVEMRYGLNAIRISADAEREWRARMERSDSGLEARALERAVKAGDAAVKSSKHVSKQRAHAITRRKAIPEEAVSGGAPVKNPGRVGKRRGGQTRNDPDG